MKAGALRHLVEIQGYTATQDSSGDEPKEFGEGSNAFAVVKASIRTLRGRELFAAQQIFATAEVEIRTRYIRGVTEGMRIKHEDGETAEYFNILNVDDVDRRHRELVMLCETGISETK